MAAEDSSVVLRIKRKRTEDPLDALLVAQVFKKPHIERKEENDKENVDAKHDHLSSTIERVFKFVGSVPQGDDIKRKDLLAKIHKQSISHENLAKSHIHDQQTIQQRLRQKKKHLNQEARFKVISSTRESETNSSSQSDSDRRLSDQANSCHDDQPEEAVDDVDLEVQRLLNVYDLVKDDESLNRSGWAAVGNQTGKSLQNSISFAIKTHVGLTKRNQLNDDDIHDINRF